jgi:hypothetical protein
MRPTPRKKRRTTVGSIVVGELPWQKSSSSPPTGGEGGVCPTCAHDHIAGVVTDSCNQVDCDCVDPFHCF